MNVIFNLAASLKVQGLKSKDAGELKSKFALNYQTKASSGDSEKNQLFSLRVKTDYATQALTRIGEEQSGDSSTAKQLAFMAGAVQMKSFVKIGLDNFASSLSDLQTLQQAKTYKWHEIVDKAQVAARTNFGLFKKQFLGGADKKVTKAVMQKLSKEDRERVAYYVIEELYTIARDRSYQYEDRIYAIDSLKAMYSDNQICPIFIEWFARTRKIQNYAKYTLKKLQNLPTENKNKEPISERAK